jgi:glutamate dehydrogenase
VAGPRARRTRRADPAGSLRLDREVELLPSTEEMHQRMDAGAGLTRPELAVLLGYSKVDLRTRLLASAGAGPTRAAGDARPVLPA